MSYIFSFWIIFEENLILFKLNSASLIYCWCMNFDKLLKKLATLFLSRIATFNLVWNGRINLRQNCKIFERFYWWLWHYLSKSWSRNSISIKLDVMNAIVSILSANFNLVTKKASWDRLSSFYPQERKFAALNHDD